MHHEIGMMASSPSGPKMYSCFWKLVDEEGELHKCNLCGHTRKQKIKNGYSNLWNHVKPNHPDWENTLAVFSGNGRGPMDAFARQVTPKARNVFGWIEWTLENDHSFRFCEQKLTRRYTVLTKISVKTLMKYIMLTASAVRKIISHLLPMSFGCVIDGWTLDSQHFSGVYAVFVNEASPSVVQEILLSCNVAEDITDETEFVEDLNENEKVFGFSADDWFDILVDALDTYDIKLTVANCANIIEFIAADNCSTNRSLSIKSGKYYS